MGSMRWMLSVSAVVMLAGQTGFPFREPAVAPGLIAVAAAKAGDGRIAGAAKKDGKINGTGRRSNGGRIGGR